MKKLFLPLTLLTAVYAAVSCSDPNLPESTPDITRLAARLGNDDDDDDNGEKIRCASMEVLSDRLRDEPGLWERMEWIEKLTQRFAERRANPNSATKGAQIEAVSTPYDGKVTIPVVVHVVYKTASQNISDAQIQSQIDVLNRDFRKTNPDVAQTPGAFAPLASDMNIEFTLVGIDRKSSSKTSWGTNDAVKYANKGGVNAVNPATTLNIWVCNIGNGILGYAQFPGGKAATDGVVIGPQYFGTSDVAGNSFYLSAPYDKGRTATHEVGHWLNLRHIWGDARCGNDLVADTPTQRTSNGGCPVFPHVTCTNGPNGDMFMNYMDYTYDRCMYLFTEGQKVRSRALFASDGVRKSFVPVQ